MSAPRALTRAWFRVGDIAARLLTLVGVLVAVSWPFLASQDAARRGLPMSWGAALMESAIWLAVAIGAHGVVGRRMSALLLLALPALRWGLLGEAFAALAWLAAVALVFVVPFALVLGEARMRNDR
jgi:hypothetical protein